MIYVCVLLVLFSPIGMRIDNQRYSQHHRQSNLASVNEMISERNEIKLSRRVPYMNSINQKRGMSDLSSVKDP